MASVESLDIRVKSLESWKATIESGAVLIENLTGSDRKKLQTAVHPIIDNYRVWKGDNNEDFTAWQIGDEIFDIENGLKVVGKVIDLPFDPATDLEDNGKFELYDKSLPKPTI